MNACDPLVVCEGDGVVTWDPVAVELCVRVDDGDWVCDGDCVTEGVMVCDCETVCVMVDEAVRV